jgi:hypothetical protein
VRPSYKESRRSMSRLLRSGSPGRSSGTNSYVDSLKLSSPGRRQKEGLEREIIPIILSASPKRSSFSIGSGAGKKPSLGEESRANPLGATEARSTQSRRKIQSIPRSKA